MGFRTAILGATGAVGQEFLRLLDERQFPLDSLTLLASKRSAGKTMTFKGETLTVQEVTHDCFDRIDLLLSSAGGSISKEFAPSAVKAGCVVVDNTSYYRMDPIVPLIIPEINSADIANHQGILANPNCSTIIMLLPLWPLQQALGIKRVVVSTYQASSGAGAQAMQELKEESLAVLNNQDYERTVIPLPYAFNLFPHNSDMLENGYCEEEMKMMEETKKIFKAPDFKVSATCIRVPILRAHSESINVEFEKATSVEDIYSILSSAPGIKVMEDRAANRWPMPIDVSGKDEVLVGRVRKDPTQENTFEMWVVGDQLLKGAALNAVQIAEAL